MAAMICSHCGKEHDERTKFCPLTGKAFVPQADSDEHAATTATGVPTLPPETDAPGRATRLMYLPKGMKLPGQMGEAGAPPAAGGALPAPPGVDLNAPASNRTMLAHVLPRPPVSTETPPTPPLRPTGVMTAGVPLPAPAAPALPTATMPVAGVPAGLPAPPPAAAPSRPSVTLPVAPAARVSANLPAQPAARPSTSMPAQPGPVPRPTPTPALPPPANPGEPDATMLDMRAPSAAQVQRGASSGQPRPAFPEAPLPPAPSSSFNADATLRASAVRAIQPGDPAAPKRSPTSPTISPEAPRKDSVPSWAVSSQDGLGDVFPPEQSAAYASASTTTGFVRLLQRTGKFYAANLAKLLLIAAFVLGPVSIVTSSLVAGLGSHSPRGASLVMEFLVYLLVMGAAWPLTAGTLTLAVLDRLHGGDMDPKRHWRFTFSRLNPLIPALVPAAFITAIGYLLFLIPGLIASLFLALVPTLVLLEGRQGADALKRSAVLVKEALGPAVGVLLIFVVLSMVVNKLIATVVPGNGFLDLVAWDLAFIALAPLPMIALAMVYLDLRRSQEGISPETLRHDIDALGL